jgi:hypothetical protein
MDGTCYEAARADRHEAREEEGDKKWAMAALERVGYEVALSPMTDTAPGPVCLSTGVDKEPGRGLCKAVWQPSEPVPSTTPLRPCCTFTKVDGTTSTV